MPLPYESAAIAAGQVLQQASADHLAAERRRRALWAVVLIGGALLVWRLVKR